MSSARRACSWLLPALAWPALACAGGASYTLDPVHTRIVFAIDHAGFSSAIGTVSGSTGTLSFDPDDWSSATLQVSIPIARFDLGDADWNRAVGRDSLLDVADHPVATFTSTRVTARDASHGSVCGDLQLRGQTRPLCLDVTLHQLKRNPMPPFRRTVGFSATATLSRSAFGISTWPTVIGDAVELRIEAEAEAARGARTDDHAPPVPSGTAPPDRP
jgi:polyisoprenoid-binding protein YceI